MKIQKKPLITALIIPLVAGGLSALFSGGMENFKRLDKPPLSPPGWLFPVAWTVLYLMMGLASYLVYVSNADDKSKGFALKLYGVQLFFNFMWSIIFFGLELYLFAFIWLMLLWILIIAAAVYFYKASKPAGYLFIPYILWVTFAAYLNFGIYYLNR